MTRHHVDCDVLNATLERDANEAHGLDPTLNNAPDPSDYACNSECQPEIAYVTGTITFDNGETVEFELMPDHHTRDGNTREYLGYAVDPCEAMHKALVDGDCFYNGEEN